MNLLKICDNCEVDFCSGACALFDYEDHQVKNYKERFFIQDQFQRRTQEELENEASKKQNNGQEKNKKKTKRKKSIKK